MGSADTPLIILLDRVTAGTSAPWQVLDGPKDVVITFTSEGATTGGTFLIEESDAPSFPGLWSQIHSQAATDFTGGAKRCVHVRLGAAGWIRVRASAAVTGGGTVSVTIAGM